MSYTTNPQTYDVWICADKQVFIEPLYQWDRDVEMRLLTDLPDDYEVQLSNTPVKVDAILHIPHDVDRVSIDNSLLETGLPIFGWVVAITATGGRRVTKRFAIPVIKKPRPTEAPPSPSQQTALEQAIAALNSYVESIPKAPAIFHATVDWDNNELVPTETPDQEEILAAFQADRPCEIFLSLNDAPSPIFVGAGVPSVAKTLTLPLVTVIYRNVSSYTMIFQRTIDDTVYTLRASTDLGLHLWSYEEATIAGLAGATSSVFPDESIGFAVDRLAAYVDYQEN